MAHNSAPRLLWLIPERKGGIQTYTDALWPSIKKEAARAGFTVLDPFFFSLDKEGDGAREVLRRVASMRPDLIHIQHEYGLFGRKLPGLYIFPKWLEALKVLLPQTKVMATAHTVLSASYRYPLIGRGWQLPLRWAANTIIPIAFHRLWNQRTWGALDGVIVHSNHQRSTIVSSGTPKTKVIPHFVPEHEPIWCELPKMDAAKIEEDLPTILLFGYVSPEKGQDLALQAMTFMKKKAKLVIGGGLRRNEDREYFRQCKDMINRLGLADRVQITGFVPPDHMDLLYRKARIVLAPFRETSGSGSLAQALARGEPVLASDLPLNLEIEERIPGSLSFFRSGDAEDCARKLDSLLDDEERLKKLGEAAQKYAKWASPESIAESHIHFYEELVGLENVK